MDPWVNRIFVQGFMLTSAGAALDSVDYAPLVENPQHVGYQ